jgi:uncharacterized protein (TIGR02145 family)
MKASFTLFLFVLIGTGSAIFSQTVTIGMQVWSTKNLDVSSYRNGDVIPQVQDSTEWQNLTTGAWCYYENKTENGTVYGKLYNWYAVNDKRGLAPKGYHIPTDNDWTALIEFLGGSDAAGKVMKSKAGWEENGNGTNSSGFLGLPGGDRMGDGVFVNIGGLGYWWCTIECNTSDAFAFYLTLWSNKLGRYNFKKANGFSVRCIKD